MAFCSAHGFACLDEVSEYAAFSAAVQFWWNSGGLSFADWAIAHPS